MTALERLEPLIAPPAIGWWPPAPGWWLLAALLPLLLGAAHAREVRVGVYDNPPKVMADADGQPTGIMGDLLQEVARQENWTLIPVPCQWEACLAGLETRALDRRKVREKVLAAAVNTVNHAVGPDGGTTRSACRSGVRKRRRRAITGRPPQAGCGGCGCAARGRRPDSWRCGSGSGHGWR